MTVTVLTPPGTGAIATVRVAGAGAWDAVKRVFRPAGKKPLPDAAELHRVWFGVLGDGGDEVVIGVEAVEPEPVVEIHCHGGRRVVAWVCGVFEEDLTPRPPLHEWRGGVQPASVPVDRHPSLGILEGKDGHDSRLNTPSPFARMPGLPGRPGVPTERGPGGEVSCILPHAPTLRTASILLDQLHGAFERAVRACLGDLSLLPRLASLAPIGRHLVEPWRVVLAGPPNVGKSSLINALAGFERSVVAPVAGTTRDVVTVRVAFDGWPVELSDTAGLRDAGEELEAEGIARTRARVADADLVVWVMDATDPVPPPDGFAGVVVANKVDLHKPIAEAGFPPPLVEGRSATQLPGGESSHSLIAPLPPSVASGSERRPPLNEGRWENTDRAVPVSALTRAGVPILISEVVRRLIPVVSTPGEGLPYTHVFADAVEAAARAFAAGNVVTARQLLRDCLG